MTHGTAPVHDHASSNSIKPHFQQMVVRICLVRLAFLLMLLLPLGLAWMARAGTQSTLSFFLIPEYSGFLVTGSTLTLFFLLSWRFFSNIIFFFRLQLAADLVLVAYLTLLTGAITSHFSFLFLGIIFLYGRYLGFRVSKIITVVIALFFLATAPLHLLDVELMALPHLSYNEYCFNFSLQILALALVLMLLRLGYGREDELLTEINRQQQDLQRSEALKYRVFDWMSSALVVLDKQGSVTVINPVALELTGLTETRQALGKKLQHLFPALGQLWSDWDKKHTLRTETPADEEGLIFGATLTPLPEENGTLILFTDITRVKELEKQVRQMEKLATIGELAAGLAHEIKNPLAGIKGSLQLLQQGSLAAEYTDKLHGVIQRDIQRLDRLLSDFLDFARPAEAHPKEIRLDSAVRLVLESMKQEYPDISFTIQDSILGKSWFWDPDHLHQILLNLLINAAQAARSSDQGEVRVGWAENESRGCIWIRDNGPGLEKDLEPSLFDPFVTTKDKGTGLGLSIAQRLAGLNSSWIRLAGCEQAGAEARICQALEDDSGPGKGPAEDRT